jgi:signal transduction histidine kinase
MQFPDEAVGPDESGFGSALRLVAPVASAPVGRVDEGIQRLRETCHEIRQPVAGVLALAAAALADPGLPGVTRSYLEQIINQAQSLGEVIRQRLDLEGPAEGGVRLIDLGRLADEVAAAQQLTYEGSLDVAPHADPILVCVNQIDVRCIISNLLSNATRAAGPAGAVTVELSRDSGLAQLVVEDTGSGFGQMPGGTGLGWRIMARCLAGCRGRISYGRGAHGGVRANLSLPLATI